jgi:hypothetical protein
MHTRSFRILNALVLGAFVHACASVTVIHSDPEGAKLYVDGEARGNTPYTYSDTKIVGSTTHLRLVKDGYQELAVQLQRNEEFEVGPCIGGVLILFPFLWIMGYRAEHRYELTPLRVAETPTAVPVAALDNW